MPPAELAIDTALARRLLQDQFPSLAALPLNRLANGWDNTLFRLGSDLVLRLPRRQLAARLIEHEQRWLPALAPSLPLPTPVPRHIGVATDYYPWSWSVVSYRAGRSADQVASVDGAADDLGRFLAALHRPAPADAPSNPVRGIPLRQREKSFRANLELVDGLDRAAVEQLWRTACATEDWANAPVWVHGDLHPANLLVRQGRIAAVLDFGDLTAGDPATDLAIAWMLMSAAERDRFWQVYSRDDQALQLRARGWALALGIVFLAHSANHPGLHRVGERTVAAVLSDR